MAKNTKFAAKQQAKSIVEAAATKAVAASDPHHALAIRLANTFDESETLNEQVDTNIAAGEEIKMGPLTMMLYMQQEYGDAFDDFPVPFTNEGNNPGLYTTQVPAKDGLTKPKEVSWYKVEFVPTTHKGKAFQDEIDAITKRLNDPNEGTSKRVLRQEKATVTARLNAFVNLTERAVALAYQIEAINDLGNVQCGYATDEEDNPKVSTKPMYIATTDPKKIAEQNKELSIGAFLNLDPAEAAANGGTYAALVATAERGAKDGKKKDYKIENVDNFEACLPEWNTFIRDAIKTAKTTRSLVSELEKDDAYVDSLVEAFDLMERLSQVTEIQQVIARRKAKEKKAA